ncbi:MAG: hypothetical protein KME45_08555 [Stenomitos rutilans HA7619-LM2]|jgi:hypothetical protein|nr:hypothetical protein [Stenomitos rutilans HA7619-LM2]
MLATLINLEKTHNGLKSLPDGQNPAIDLGLYAWLEQADDDGASTSAPSASPSTPGTSSSTPSRYVGIALFQEKKMDSQIVPGNMAYTAVDKKGWWIQAVKVTIWVQENKSDGANLFQLMYGEPKTLNRDGTSTSAASLNLGASGGMMSGGPTVTGSASGEWTNTTSFSYKDFTLYDRSANNKLIHEWSLTGYKDANTAGHFQKANIPLPPPAAISNFSVIEQGSWKVPDGIEECLVKIIIDVDFKFCGGVYALVKTFYNRANTPRQVEVSKVISLKVDPSTGKSDQTDEIVIEMTEPALHVFDEDE